MPTVTTSIDTQAIANPNKASRASTVGARLAAPAILLATLALRLAGFGAESLWYDETFSVYLASQSLPDLVAHTARDTHPPAYYALLHAWQRLTDPTLGFGFEYLFSWPSLWFSMLVSALTYALARRAYGPRTGLIALALTGLHPFAFWYAREVRMYAPAAATALLMLWMMLAIVAPGQISGQRRSNKRRWSALAAYVVAALIGLYTLYFTAFWLAALNVAVAMIFWRNCRSATTAHDTSTLRDWLVAQGIVVIGYLPWLPTLIRQTFDPAVAAWRTPFAGAGEALDALNQGVSSLLVAHTSSFGMAWLVTAILLAGVVLLIRHTRPGARDYTFIYVTVLLLPLILMLIVSVAGPPIYHVRYMALSATVTPIVVAGLVHALARRAATVAVVTAAVVIQSAGLYLLLTDPVHARDDHRAAVARLAANWRPGDAILVNAGWTYTALAVYWPRAPQSVYGARPPQLLDPARLNTPKTTPTEQSLDRKPQPILAGSVDGPPTLGWGLPNSDHFAMSSADTLTGLEQLAFDHPRLWHYRMYDTVSDPHRLIRTRLTTLGQIGLQSPIPGPSFGLLERYDPSLLNQSAALLTPSCCGFRERPAGSPLEPDTVMTVESVVAADTVPAGETLFVEITYHVESGSSPVSLSVRLHDQSQRLVAQSDEALPITPGLTVQHIMALAVPAGASPTDHHLSLVLYDPATLQPLDESSVGLLPHAPVRVRLPRAYPAQRNTLARFDYLALESAQWATTGYRPGDDVDMSLVWRPQSSAYRDDYTLTLSLSPMTGPQGRALPHAQVVYTVPLATPDYPSSRWEAGYPVIQAVRLDLPHDIPSGMYAVTLAMQRTSDGLPIRARHGWRPFSSTGARLGDIQIAQ